jgi:hypothetical protein
MWPPARIVLVVMLTLLVGCGPTGEALLPDTHADAATTVRDGQRPPLTVIRRQGDPEPALAVAVAHDAGPDFNRGLGRALLAELSRVGLEPAVSLFTRGLVVSMRTGPVRANLARDVRSAVLAAARAANPESSSPALDPCDPLPTFSAQRAELGRQNVSLALVGDPARVDALADSFLDTEPWPDGDVPESSLPGEDVYAFAKAPTSALSLALVSSNPGRAFAARRALLQHELLGHIAREYPPGFTLDAIAASQLPAGGCLSLAFSATEPVREQDAARLLLSVREIAESELVRAEDSGRLLPALLASGSTGAAELAAWQGLVAAPQDSDLRAIHVRQTPEATSAQGLLDTKLQGAVGHARGHTQLPSAVHVERGQGRVWTALSSACPVAHETRADAGFTALGLEHAALDGPAGALDAYLGFGGPALVAHVPVLGETSPDAVADAIALGLFRSLGTESELNALALAQRERAQDSPLVDFAAEMLTSGRPSRVLGRGTRDSLSRVSPTAVRHALLGFLGSPLSLTVLANQDEQQAKAVQRRLGRLLAPFLPSSPSCPEVRSPAVPGSYVLVVDEAGVDAVLAYPVPVAQLPAARAVAFLLNRDGGFLEHALITPGLATGASAAATGTRGGEAALIVAVDAEPERIESATQQLRALMQRVAGGAIVEGHFRIATSAWPPTSSATPEQRLFPVEGALPSLDEIRRFAHSYLSEEKLVVVYGKRRE